MDRDQNRVRFGSLNSLSIDFLDEQHRANTSLRRFRKHTALFMTVIAIFVVLFMINIFLVVHAPTKKEHQTIEGEVVNHTEPGK